MVYVCCIRISTQYNHNNSIIIHISHSSQCPYYIIDLPKHQLIFSLRLMRHHRLGGREGILPLTAGAFRGNHSAKAGASPTTDPQEACNGPSQQHHPPDHLQRSPKQRVGRRHESIRADEPCDKWSMRGNRSGALRQGKGRGDVSEKTCSNVIRSGRGATFCIGLRKVVERWAFNGSHSIVCCYWSGVLIRGRENGKAGLVKNHLE
jgi:hypothetical protein